VVYRWSCPVLATVCDSHDMPHTGATCFLFVDAVIVDLGCNPLRMLLPPLLATLGALLDVMDGDAGRRILAIAWDRLPTT
jgi:hypothetical protein